MKTAYLLIRCDQGLEKTVIERLKGIDRISECVETVGTFDIIARLQLESAGQEVSAILRMPEVRRVTQLECR